MTPLVSVYTPTHDPRFLSDCWDSLRSQTYQNFEWIVGFNGQLPDGIPRPTEDDRVRWLHLQGYGGRVGALKGACCRAAKGDILVELDHDDTLTPDALDLVVRAFRNYTKASLVFSNFAQINEDGSPNHDQFDAVYGWSYYSVSGGHLACGALPATPHNLGHIWYAPNHVRAFRRSAYEAAGGYDADLVVLDDQDLMSRLYLQGDFVHIPSCLYYQRVHPEMTQKKHGNIASGQWVLYDQYIEPMALAWAKRRGLRCLDLGSAPGKQPGYEGVDLRPGPNVDLVHDATAMTSVDTDSVGVIRAVDFLEHVADKVALWEELYRVLAPGGMVLSLTPSTDGRGAFQDPTHCAYYNENSFWYLTDRNYSRYVSDQSARFQVSRLVTYFPGPWHEENQIPYVCANLIALKPGMDRNGGPITI